MPSSTLTWRQTTAAKTGTAIADLIADVVSAVDAVSSDDDYKWQVASSNSGGTPYYVVLKRKNGDPGRILLVMWTSSPAGNNSAILDVTPNSNTVFLAYFPAGNVDSPSNLTASSGTIMGDDTACTKVVPVGDVISNLYAANVAPVVWDSAEAVHITFQNTTSAVARWCAAGGIYVDASDEVVDGVASSTTQINTFGGTSWTPSFSGSAPSAGGASSTSANQCLRAIIDGVEEIGYFAYALLGPWHQASSNNPLIDTGTSRAWFAPMLVLQRSVGVGITLKMRQFAFGPPTSAGFAQYNTASLTPAAINANGNSSGAASPWFCNFKV